MKIQNNPINKNVYQNLSKIDFQGRNQFLFDPFFDEFSSFYNISDKDILKLFPGKLNLVRDFLKLEDYNLDVLRCLKEKGKTEVKYLLDIASKKDAAGYIRIPAENLSDFASISHEKLKFIEPIILSKRDIGIWNYSPEYILNIAKLDDKRLDTFVELAKCNVIPNSTKGILENTNVNWDRTIEKAKSLKNLYGKDLREIEFYSNSRGDNFFLVDVQLPHREDKSDWQNFKRITVRLDNNVTPISKKKLDTNISSYVDNIYNRVCNKLQLFTKDDLNLLIKNISDICTDANEEEILLAVKKLTQFSSYKSIPLVGQKLKESGVTEFANLGEFYKYFEYFHKYKKLFTLSDSLDKKFGIIFSKNDLKNVELMKRLKDSKNNPSFKDVVFINLEGFTDGVNIFNDNKELLEKTVKILKEAKSIKNKNLTFEECVSTVLNGSIENSLKKLGFNVITIKLDAPVSKNNIIEQINPIMPTKDLIHSTIETIADKYSPDRYTYNKYSKLIAKYYEENVNIFSKQSIIEDLKKINCKINEYIVSNNLSRDKLYVIENVLDCPKSYNIINKMYGNLFNLPENHLIQLKNISEINKLPENSIFLILDDVVGTGKSFIEIGNYYKDAKCVSKNQHILFVPIMATNKGVKNIREHINSSSRENSDSIIYLKENLINNASNMNIFGNFFIRMLPSKFYQISDKGFGKQATCIAFPYMSPDNNSYVSANLVNLFLPSKECIKSIPDTFKEIEENSIYYSVFGQKKDNLQLNSFNDQVASWFEKLKDFLFKN